MSEEPPKILVTGGAGFIGANLVRLLLDRGYVVTVLDDFSAGREEYLSGLRVRLIRGSVTDEEFVHDALAGQEGVVHLAAQSGVPRSLADPMQDCQINVRGTLNLLEACRRETSRSRKRMRFVFASSMAPLGRQSPPATEKKVPLPISPYGASKLAGEAYCLAYYGSWDLGTIALRFANVYGPYSLHKTSVIPRFFKDIRTKGEISIHGDGQQTRDFIYVEDLCEAILLALNSKVGGEVFHIATGVETPILKLAEMVKGLAGCQTTIQYSSARPGDIRRNYSSIVKVQNKLKWAPGTNLRDGLLKTWEWFEKQQRC